MDLEDNFGDVVGKAQRGLGISDSELSKKSGADCNGMLKTATKENLSIKMILLTHAHPDHVEDLPRLREETGAQIFAPAREPVPGAENVDEGKHFRLGNLDIEARLTWGHSPG